MYQATVPVFRHYLSRIADLVAIAGPDALDLPQHDISARQRFSIAAGLSMRIACPLAGRDLPDLPEALGPRLAVARALLGGMKPAEFDPDPARLIRHDLTGDGFSGPGGRIQAAEFVHILGLPSFFFEISLGYGALQAAGLALTQSDFDGYPRAGAGPDLSRE